MPSPCKQAPETGSQLSPVQTLLSSQSGGGPVTQAPPEQKLSVQALPSSQSGGGPGMQLPPEHTSLTEQAFPSMHGPVLLTWTQPIAGLQLSSVHPFPSSQFGGGPVTHDPPAQTSPVVHALLSEQELVLSTCTQPIAGLQLSSVQMLLSLQFICGPGRHAPPEHRSFFVQAFASLHGLALLT